MLTVQAFNASTWIAENLFGGAELLPETTAAVANFTLMWNLFEDMVCRNHANVREFKQIAQTLSQAQVSAEDEEALRSCLSFWVFRYRRGTGFSARFEGLHFRPNDRREVVEAVLRGESEDLSSRLLALMVIVYRLRNNLFHGLKTIERLNDQVENLEMGSKCLAALLKVSRTRLVLHRAPHRQARASSLPTDRSS
jgi:hypothetical protein